jgi:enterochelin esterase family protein
MSCRILINVWALTAILYVAFAYNAFAQDQISRNQPVTREIAAGKADSFSISLNDGDYVSGSVSSEGTAQLTILNPDRSIDRRFPVAANAERKFAFVAEGSGQYSISITNPGNQPIKYTLVVGTILPLGERLQPEPWKDPFPSPRIEELRRKIAKDESNTEAFWKEIAEQGTPLAEPLGSDGKYQLVTFLWRALHETKNVLVLGSFLDAVSPDSISMHRLGNSDVWYLTMKMPAGARFTYSLSPNDPMTEDGPRANQRDATRQMDPLNPHYTSCPNGTNKFRCISVAELPQAPQQTWFAKQGVAEGRIEKGTIKSTIQNLDRSFSIYLPAGYSPNGSPYPVVILFDGEVYLSPVFGYDVLPTLNDLIAARKIAPTVVVFVETVTNGRRTLDLIGNSKFIDSIATEVVPWVRAHYKVTKEPARTVVGGYSAGGLAAAHAGLRHSEVFGNVFSQSGSFWWAPDHNGGFCGPECSAAGNVPNASMDGTTEPNWMAKQFLASPKLPLRFYLEAGAFELDMRGKGGDILEPTRHLRDVLRAKGYSVEFHQFVGGHDGLSWRGDFADALITLLGSP